MIKQRISIIQCSQCMSCAISVTGAAKLSCLTAGPPGISSMAKVVGIPSHMNAMKKIILLAIAFIRLPSSMTSVKHWNHSLLINFILIQLSEDKLDGNPLRAIRSVYGACRARHYIAYTYMCFHFIYLFVCGDAQSARKCELMQDTNHFWKWWRCPLCFL